MTSQDRPMSGKVCLVTGATTTKIRSTVFRANGLSPGLVATEFGTREGRLASFSKRVINATAGISPEAGARTSIHLATSPEVEGVTTSKIRSTIFRGKYFVKQKAVPSSPASYDQNAARRLWLISAEMTGLVASA